MSYGQSKDGSILLEVCESVTCASGHACGAGSSLVAQGASAKFCDSRDRIITEIYNNTAGQAMAAPSKPGGGAKRGGRPVTWIGGGGLDPKKLAGLGVPTLRTLFNQVFGEPTASNNAGWLRRKLSESPDSVHGQRRSAVVRARDSGAAIWNSSLPLVTLGGCDDGGDVMDCDAEEVQEHTAADESATAAGTALLVHGACDGGRRSLKRSATSAESADTLGYRGSGNNMHCASSPSGSDSATPTGTQLGILPGNCSAGPSSPNRFSTKPHKNLSAHHHKHHSKGSSKQYSQYQTQQGCQGACVGLVIRPETFSDRYLGLKVMVYWPQDHKWWEATICKLNTAACQLQLLYSDMTEEAVSGGDFIDLLTKGHLALAAGVAPPPAAPAPVACTNAPGVSCAPGLPDMADVSWLDCGGTSLATGVRSQSCLLPTAIRDIAPAPAPMVRSASASFTGDAGSGSGSGEASATLGGDVEELAAKRQCFEATDNAGSGAGSGSYGNDDRPDSFGGFCPAAGNPAFGQLGQQQLPQGPDASNLGAWFHAQQQQQLQMQMQAQQQNMQLQQQMHMQMQQQMAAHMAMQQAAAAVGQLVQLQAACMGAGMGVPMCLVQTAAPAAAAAPACSGPLLSAQPSLPSPFASALATSQQPLQSQQQRVGSPLAAGNSNLMLANDIEQLKQLQQRLRLAVSSSLPEAATPRWQAAAADQCMAAAPAAVACPGTFQQQQQQVAKQCSTTPVLPSIKVEDPLVIPDPAVEGQRRRSTPGDATVVPELSTAAPPPLAAAVQSYPSSEQQVITDGNDIDCLLSKPGDIFDLSALETEQKAELESQIGDINALNGAMDLAEGSMDVSDPSNSCNDSLCESLAEQLVVAGLDAEAATAYYTYNMFEESPAEQQGLDSMQSQGSGDLDAMQQGLGSIQGQDGLKGLKVQAGGFESRVEGVQASAGLESEFAHIFDD